MNSWKHFKGSQKEGVLNEAKDDEDEPFRLDTEATRFQSSRNAADFYRTKPVMDRRIHVMGIGNVGTFVAHAIRGIPNPPPVSLIFSYWDKRNQWENSPQKLKLITDGDIEVRDGYDAEIALPRIRSHGKEVGLSSEPAEGATRAEDSSSRIFSGESTEPISSLIVCHKAPHVLSALSSVKHRLHKDSVILFLQNGMGTVEEVNREIFPDPATRPYYMLGINSHGLNNASGETFTTTHAGFGTLLLGIMPHERDRNPDAPYEPTAKFILGQGPGRSPSSQVPPPEELNPEYAAPTSTGFQWTPNQRYLLRTLLRTPVLGAASFSPPDLLQMQLEKLAANCIINPLTVLLDGRNGSILYNFALTRTMRLLLSEISLVIRSLPELQYIPNVESRFDPGRLETIVVGIANKTRDNISSMLADTRAGRQTEIDYINGWIVKRGEELGIRCLTNYMLVQLVKGKAALIRREAGEDVPLVQETEEEQSQGDIVVKQKTAKRKPGPKL